MSSANPSELAKEKMLQAEAALADYFRGFIYDPEREKQLAEALEGARTEYLTKLANP